MPYGNLDQRLSIDTLSLPGYSGPMKPELPKDSLSPLSQIKLGIYKHYKGGYYKVLGAARNENTLEEVVVYRSISRGLETGEGPLWVRPLEQFKEEIEYRGKQVPRFQYVSET